MSCAPATVTEPPLHKASDRSRVSSAHEHGRCHRCDDVRRAGPHPGHTIFEDSTRPEDNKVPRGSGRVFRPSVGRDPGRDLRPSRRKKDARGSDGGLFKVVEVKPTAEGPRQRRGLRSISVYLQQHCSHRQQQLGWSQHGHMTVTSSSPVGTRFRARDPTVVAGQSVGHAGKVGAQGAKPGELIVCLAETLTKQPLGGLAGTVSRVSPAQQRCYLAEPKAKPLRTLDELEPINEVLAVAAMGSSVEGEVAARRARSSGSCPAARRPCQQAERRSSTAGGRPSCSFWAR